MLMFGLKNNMDYCQGTDYSVSVIMSDDDSNSADLIWVSVLYIACEFYAFMSFIGTKLGVNSGPSFCKLPFLLLPCKQCVLARRHTLIMTLSGPFPQQMFLLILFYLSLTVSSSNLSQACHLTYLELLRKWCNFLAISLATWR